MNNKYCLDTNVFIEGWNKYYSPEFCKSYWDIIAELGKEGVVFISVKVKEEIAKTDDNLARWIKNKQYMVKELDENVQKCLKSIYAADPSHSRLVDSIKGRSEADPWIIAHAMAENAIVVTKEMKNTNPASNRIRIPDVCVNMGVRCIDDYALIREVNIAFNCRIEA